MKNTEEEEEEEEDYYDDISEYDGIMEMKEKEKEEILRQEEDKLWYRGGIESLKVGGQRETSKYRAIAAAKPGVWYEVSQEDQGIAKEPFLRISNELSRSWDELIANKKAALTPQVLGHNCNIFQVIFKKLQIQRKMCKKLVKNQEIELE